MNAVNNKYHIIFDDRFIVFVSIFTPEVPGFWKQGFAFFFDHYKDKNVFVDEYLFNDCLLDGLSNVAGVYYDKKRYY